MKKQYTWIAPASFAFTGSRRNGAPLAFSVDRDLVAKELRWARRNKVSIAKIANGFAFCDLQYVRN
jgi:hypothetical protein